MRQDPTPAAAGPRRIAALVFLLLAGILAGTQLGKIAPLVAWYRAEAGFSLVMVGWLTSTLGLFVALAALPAAFAIDRAGLYRSYLVSAIALGAGGVGLALFDGPLAALAARLVEAFGYLILVIAIPALLATLAPERLKAPALAIWGGFVPLGYAVADFLSAAMLPAHEPQSFLLVSVVSFIVLAALAAWLARGLEPIADTTRQVADTPGAARMAASFSASVALSALAFGVYVILSIGFFTFLPSFVAEGPAVALSAGMIALLVPLGNVLAGVLLKGGDARFAALVVMAGFLVSAASAVPFFGAADPIVATVSAMVFAVAGGVVAAAIFASVPFIVPPGGSSAIVIGLIAQSGGLGTLAGPPLAGYIIGQFGWAGFGWTLAAFSLLGFACMAPLLARRRRLA
ncbi:MFS transporter [Nitratireductor alexandrii]|uniref:MFS transporter n=1 Tax=Nitratireductor alexandrii TaxID=2448161 RepID=UPI000FD79205|nr:MFS transporter [Nitratireductor alexandrii]